MKETRQQRRARERAEAKAARRSPQRPPARGVDQDAFPGRAMTYSPNLAGLFEGPDAGDRQSTPTVMEIRLSGTHFYGDDLDENEDPYVGWGAEWGWQGDSVGVEEHGGDLTELVEIALQDVKRMADGRDIRLVWGLEDIDGLPAGAIENELAAAEVRLPDRL